MREPAEAGDHLKISARLTERELKDGLQVRGCLTCRRRGFGDSTLRPLDVIGTFSVSERQEKKNFSQGLVRAS